MSLARGTGSGESGEAVPSQHRQPSTEGVPELHVVQSNVLLPRQSRPQGTGSIVEVIRRRGDGRTTTRYRARLRDPYAVGGFAFDETFSNRTAARRALAQAVALVTIGEPVPDPRRRVEPLFDEYEAAIRARRRRNSFLSTERHLRMWIRPYFSGMALYQMNSGAELRRFATTLRTTPSSHTGRVLKESTVGHIIQVVSSFLQMCLADGSIRINAARQDYLGKPERKATTRINLPGDVRWWSLHEAVRYQATALDLSHGRVLVFLLQSCLRVSEALGLLEENLHLDAPVPYIDVLTQVVRADDDRAVEPATGRRQNRGYRNRGHAQMVTDRLKTPAAYRRLYLADAAVTLLREQLEWRDQTAATATTWDRRYRLVFTSSLGAPMCKSTLHNQHRRICALAGVRRIVPHGLRHTGLSLLIAAGVPLTLVRQIAGHQTMAELEAVYAHVIVEYATRGALAMSELLPLVRTAAPIPPPEQG